MTRPSWRTALAAAALASACGSDPTRPSGASTPSARPSVVAPGSTSASTARVALISIDGLRADVVSAQNTPNLWALVTRGAYSFSAQTISPSNTLPGHASMLTGVEPAVHHVTFDEYRDSFQLSTPTVVSLVHAAGKRSVVVVGKDKFRQLVGAGSVDSYTESKNGDEDIVNDAITQIPLGFDLLFVHLPQVDQVGHFAGWMSPAYIDQVKAADAALGRLVSYLPIGTTVIVTSDHGGTRKAHGTDAKTDLTIPWIIEGPRVLHRGAVSRRLRITDTAATILDVLSIKAPANITGRSVSEVFEAP